MLLGQEDHAHTVLASRRQGHAHGTIGRFARFGHVVAEQLVRQLNEDASAVTHESVSTHGTPVVEVFEDLERLAHDGMGLLPLDMGHKANAARIVLVGGVVQAVLLHVLDVAGAGHTKLLKN
jgi:hypothetical protein